MECEYSNCSEAKLTSYEVQKNLLCALTYLMGCLSGLFALHLKPYCQDRDIRMHAWQSILFSAAWFLCSLILDLCLESVFYSVSVGPGSIFLVSICNLGLSVCLLFLWVKQMVSAHNSKYFHIPVLSEIAIRLSEKADHKKGEVP